MPGPEQANLWDLFSAFQKVLLEAEASRPTSIIYDETPIHVYMDRILERIRQKGRVNFRELIPAGVTRARFGQYAACHFGACGPWKNRRRTTQAFWGNLACTSR